MILFTQEAWDHKSGMVVRKRDWAPLLQAVRDNRALAAGIRPVERDANVRLAAQSAEMFALLTKVHNALLADEIDDLYDLTWPIEQVLMKAEFGL